MTRYDFVSKHYILICVFYFVVIIGMGMYLAFRKKEIKEITLTEQQNKKAIHWVLIPLLFPTIFAMFAGSIGLLTYGILYALDEYIYINNDTFIVIIMFWLVSSVILSIKAYKSIYATYHNKL